MRKITIMVDRYDPCEVCRFSEQCPGVSCFGWEPIDESVMLKAKRRIRFNSNEECGCEEN